MARTLYAHLEKILTQKGKEVKKLDVIGKLGRTGTEGYHLHFEVFGEKIADLKRKHWRKWAYYPTGKSKQWIVEHYENPWKWLEEDIDGMPQWALEDWGIAKRIGIAPDDPSFDGFHMPPVSTGNYDLRALTFTLKNTTVFKVGQRNRGCF